MAKLLINLRGTSGSGKTTVARTFLNNFPNETLRKRDGKVAGVRIDVTGFTYPLFLVGKYDNTCGGMDTVPTQVDCAELATKAYQMGHVICEGLLASGVGPGATLPAALISAAGPHVRFLCLNTPLELCIERVKARREAAGNDKPFNPANTESKYQQVQRSFEMLEEANQPVFWIDYQNAYQQVYDMIKEADANG